MRKIITTILLTLLPAKTFALTKLEELEQGLAGATRNPDNSQLPQGVYQIIAVFLRERVMSFLISGTIALAIIFLMYGSLQYFTAYGDENRATNAKKTITYAFLGLIIAFAAMGIAGLVEFSVTNNQILNAPKAPIQ